MFKNSSAVSRQPSAGNSLIAPISHWVCILVCAALAWFSSEVYAQPAEFVDLGNIVDGTNITSADVSIAAGQVKWFKINVVNPITPLERWIDFDTTGPAIISNSMVAIYDVRGNFVNWDDNSGGGLGSGLAAAMSFGGGSGEKLSGENTTWGGGRISDGSWGHNLPVGIYYIAVCGYTPTFPFDDPTLFNITTNSTESGVVRLRVASGQVLRTTYNERFHGDGGGPVANAQTLYGSGPLTKLITAFGERERDTFKIHISDPNAFRVIATPSGDGGGVYGGRLFLFDASGRGFCGVNWTAGGPTFLSGLPGLTVGDYYLTVSSNCPGENGQQAVPYDASGKLIWDFSSSSNWNITIRPNGPGAANPMLYLGRQSDCGNNTGAYYVRLDLEGVSYVSNSNDCPADYNGDGFVTGDDFDDFVVDFIAGC